MTNPAVAPIGPGRPMPYASAAELADPATSG
jgi:hypothetical protein